MSDDHPDPNAILSSEEIQAYLRRGGKDALAWALKNHGTLTVRLAMLGIAIEDRIAQTRPRNYPPLVFIAYKWEDDAHSAWVTRLAAHLRARGWEVMLDREHLDPGASNFVEVPGYIAHMVGCDCFLAVVTERYLEFVEERQHRTTWVHDEYAVASRLRNAGKIQIQPVWKSFSHAPEKLFLKLGAVDLRDDPDRFERLDSAFPVYAGPSLSAEEHDSLARFMRDFDAQFGEDGPDATALGQLLDHHRKFEALYDYRIRAVRFLWRAGQVEQAYRIALPIRDECLDDDDILQLAYVFDAAGDHPTMFRLLYRARWQRRLIGSVIYHYFVGETLRERNSVFAALNHFRWLRRSQNWSALPETMRTTIESTIDEYEAQTRAIRADHVFRCAECSATYVFAGALQNVCGECGTLYETSEKACPVCDNDATVPLRLLLPGGRAEGLQGETEMRFSIQSLESDAPPPRVLIECPICNDGAMECA